MARAERDRLGNGWPVVGAGAEHDLDISVQRRSSDALEQFKAVRRRHAQVEKRHVEVASGVVEELPRGRAILGHRDVVFLMHGQDFVEDPA